MNKEWLERQKENFKKHKANLMDYGNIKVLDFKNPDSNEYRIRFIFEEDYCRLHITGDLGDLIASNYSNMTYEKFNDFVNNIGYFEEKIDCLSRAIYRYDYNKARKEIREHLEDYSLCDDVVEYQGFDFLSDEENISDFLDNVLCDFSDKEGIGSRGLEIFLEIDHDVYQETERFGKEDTGILELYMMAFKLAQEDLKESK